MSGEIFQPLETLEETDGVRLEPLLCRLCNETFEEPRVLQCYHTFCAGCLRGRGQDGSMSCPFCGYVLFTNDVINIYCYNAILQGRGGVS